MADDGDVFRGGAATEEAADVTCDPFVLRARSALGATLRDKWRLDVLLGVGRMAAVYAATHRNGRRAAVRLLHPEVSAEPVMRERFLREGYLANSVPHDGVVKVLDDDAGDDGSLFLVTELLEGETLEERRLRRGGRLGVQEVLEVADRILDVLAAAHARGVVHRELTPDNVFLTRAGEVKVLGFGIAWARGLTTGGGVQPSDDVGSMAYVPPEQLRGAPAEVDERSDLWACAAMMFTSITGRHVFDRPPSEEDPARAGTRVPPALASVAPEVGSAVAHVIDRALRLSKSRRWPDARRMRRALRRAYEAEFGRSLGGDAGGAPHARARAGAVVAALAAALGVTVLGVVITSAVARAHPRSLPPYAAIAAPATSPAALLAVPEVHRAEVLAPAEAFSNKLLDAPPPLPPAAGTSASSPSRAPDGRTVQSSAASPAPAPASAAAPVHPGAGGASCAPPYTVDPITGKRHWKLDCL